MIPGVLPRGRVSRYPPARVLLTLTATCLQPMLTGKAKARLALEDLPRFTRDVLGLGGLNLSTDLLVGADRARLEDLRERADKAACACLLLIESEPQSLASADAAAAAAAVQRVTKVVEAAHVLGCSSVAVRVQGADSDALLVPAAQNLRKVVERGEKLDINVLISPHAGLTRTPERVAEMIKKVGGFRIGTFPDFQAAAESPDPSVYLHRLTPYATVVSASTVQFGPVKGKDSPDVPMELIVHKAYDLKPLVEAVSAVGYDGPLALDYRGTGDVTMGLARSRDVLRRVLGDLGADE